ncbi:MAG: glycosyltransferase, partial [Candidatus Acidiferrum sp.]
IADAVAIKENLQSRHHRLPPCDIIPYGSEIVSSACAEELKRFGVAPGSYYLVVCRFEPENLIREIIEGFLESDTKARLVLVGDHLRKNAYVESLRAYKNERLLFTGPVYETAKIQALRYFCRAYLHGHSVGGTNPSLLEAMGCGNAVIANDNPFNREVLGDAGLFFLTTKDMGACIGRIDYGATDVAEMRAKAVVRVKQFYTWERITDHYCELISLMESKTRSRSETIQCAPRYSTHPVPAAGAKEFVVLRPE